jgi:hypothetical protein
MVAWSQPQIHVLLSVTNSPQRATATEALKAELRLVSAQEPRRIPGEGVKPRARLHPESLIPLGAPSASGSLKDCFHALRKPFDVGRNHISLTRQKPQPFQWLARLPPWFSHIDSLPTDSGPNSNPFAQGPVLVHGVDPRIYLLPPPQRQQELLWSNEFKSVLLRLTAELSAIAVSAAARRWCAACLS